MQPMSRSNQLRQDSERANGTLFCRIQYGLGSASDYYAFDQLVGSSNFDATYDSEDNVRGNVRSYPLYHTSYETFSMVKKFIDPDFSVREPSLRKGTSHADWWMI